MKNDVVTEWPKKIETAIVDYFKDVGKGYFNIYETNKAT
jgi:hypothetical protein